MNRVLIFIGVFALLAQCRPKEEVLPTTPASPKPVLPDTPYSYGSDEMPPSFLAPGLQFFEFIPSDNFTTDEGATLGRVLFYDRNLSANRTVSCGSCHIQEYAFSDPRTFSAGFEGELTPRNSMGLFNKQFERHMFWDRRVPTLEDQVLVPLEDEREMGMTLEAVIERVEAAPYYEELFVAAFGDAAVTEERIAKALAQFVRAIQSFDSRYEQGLANDFANWSEQELLGKTLFFNGETRCNQCHMTAHFFSPAPSNNGLDEVYTDEGAGEGYFKTPTLLNIALTAPYMHDGRFATLEEVLEHYNTGIASHPQLSDQLTEELNVGGTPIQLNLTENEKAALVAFLHTLTDESMVTDPRYSDPFH